jgi:hypothetical protein
MPIQPIDVFVNAWLGIAVPSAAYVACDEFRGNPEPAVMKWGFRADHVVRGPIGLLLYVMADKEPASGTHETFVRPFWKQGVGPPRTALPATPPARCARRQRTFVANAAIVRATFGRDARRHKVLVQGPPAASLGNGAACDRVPSDVVEPPTIDTTSASPLTRACTSIDVNPLPSSWEAA